MKIIKNVNNNLFIEEIFENLFQEKYFKNKIYNTYDSIGIVVMSPTEVKRRTLIQNIIQS